MFYPLLFHGASTHEFLEMGGIDPHVISSFFRDTKGQTPKVWDPPIYTVLVEKAEVRASSLGFDCQVHAVDTTKPA